MAGVVIILLVVAGVVAGLVWVAKIAKAALRELRTDWSSQLAERTAEVDRHLQSVTETMDRRLGELDSKVDRRLENATQTTNKIHESLGKQAVATAEMLEQARGLSRLEHALRPPKARGGFGELLLENLLRDRLPRGSYEMQYGFSTGERVDAVIKVDRLVPVDAKFPLDNFERLVEAANDDERLLFEKAFGRDLKQHVDAIASKYIRPDEGTYEFALMYLPAEGVYYELICGKTGELLQYAHEKRVFPVSPTTFTSQLQVIALGLKGLQIEERAQEVMAYCGQLQRDFDSFRDDFEVVGKHLGNAQSKFAAADRRLDRFETRLARAADDQDELEGETVLELPGAAA